VDDQRALQMAIISQTFMDKMCPNKPIKLTNKPNAGGWKQNTLKAMFYLMQTAFTLGVVLSVLWYVQPGNNETITTHYTSLEHTQVSVHFKLELISIVVFIPRKMSLFIW
jgi:hypothetical protein